MSTSSSSSDYASNFTDEKYSSNEGASEDSRAGVQSSSFMEQLYNSQDDNAKGKGIISGATRIHQCPSDTQAVEIDGERERDLLCGCCCLQFQLENMIHCLNGHLFCFDCLRRRVEEITYGGLRANAFLSCMDTDGCKESISLSEIRRALPNDLVEKYENRQAHEAIAEAKVEGLVYCPSCSIPYEVDKCVKVLKCPNTKCLQTSCIQCKKLPHSPLLCKQVQKMSGTALRVEVEERMTKAVVRECNICHAELIKMYGCNKVKCRCGNIMCYVCRVTIDRSKYHFCTCVKRYRSEGGKPCQICNRCSLMEEVAEDIEALDAKEKALKELADKEPKLLDLEIGPPLKKRSIREFHELPRPQYQHGSPRYLPSAQYHPGTPRYLPSAQYQYQPGTPIYLPKSSSEFNKLTSPLNQPGSPRYQPQPPPYIPQNSSEFKELDREGTPAYQEAPFDNYRRPRVSPTRFFEDDEFDEYGSNLDEPWFSKMQTLLKEDHGGQ